MSGMKNGLEGLQGCECAVGCSPWWMVPGSPDRVT